jgi:hypothetical protein
MTRRFPILSIVAVTSVLCGVAHARDFIVVGSSDPALLRGQSFDAGAQVPLAAGRTATLMHASGNLITLRGARGGVALPARAGSPAESDRLSVLRMMVAPAPRAMVGDGRVSRTRAATRGGLCPGSQGLTTLDAIVLVQKAGCETEAAAALEAWIAAQPAPEKLPEAP